MTEEWKILLSGSGGQGLGKGGKILAEAAIYEGLSAVQSQSYGAQARGGFSHSEVIISKGEILYPLVERPNLLVALTQEAYNLNSFTLSSSGILIYDLEAVKPGNEEKKYGFPLTKTAREICHGKGAILVALGIIVVLCRIVREESVQKAINKNFSGSDFLDNCRCFKEGLKMARR